MKKWQKRKATLAEGSILKNHSHRHKLLFCLCHIFEGQDKLI